jgi:ketosteroid isomerase-like protein
VTESPNVKLVRSIFADWLRGDWRSADWANPNIVFERAESAFGGRWTGLAGMAEGWRDWLSSWDDFRVAEVEEYRELDDERVVVFHRFTGRGKASGLEVQQARSTGASLFHIRDGKVIRLVSYSPRERAVADLGLAADPDPKGG